MAIGAPLRFRRGKRGLLGLRRIGDDGLTRAEREAGERRYQQTIAAHPTTAEMDQVRERARALMNGQRPQV